MNPTFHVKTRSKRLLADILTPVGIFLRLRDQYPYSVILESADYHAMQNSFSYIACDAVASIVIDNDVVTKNYPDGTTETYPLAHRKDAVAELKAFADTFQEDENHHGFITNGLFGHMTYDAVEYYEDIEIQDKRQKAPYRSSSIECIDT